MIYNQVQSFQINDYSNYYVDIEINGCRALHRKSVADSSIARVISWLGKQGQLTALTNWLFDCYIRVCRSFSIFIQLGGYVPETRHSTYIQDLEVYLRDHARQLECSKQ